MFCHMQTNATGCFRHTISLRQMSRLMQRRNFCCCIRRHAQAVLLNSLSLHPVTHSHRHSSFHKLMTCYAHSMKWLQNDRPHSAPYIQAAAWPMYVWNAKAESVHKQGTAGHSRAQQGTAGRSRAQQGAAGRSRAQQTRTRAFCLSRHALASCGAAFPDRCWHSQ